MGAAQDHVGEGATGSEACLARLWWSEPCILPGRSEQGWHAHLTCRFWPLLEKPFRTNSGAEWGRLAPSTTPSNEQSLSLVPELRRGPQNSCLAFFFHSDDSPVFLVSAFFFLEGVVKLPLWKQVSNLALTCCSAAELLKEETLVDGNSRWDLEESGMPACGCSVQVPADRCRPRHLC